MAAVQDKQTVRVKLNTSIAGHRFDAEKRYVGDYVHAAGEVVEMPRAEAERFIQCGRASAVEKE